MFFGVWGYSLFLWTGAWDLVMERKSMKTGMTEVSKESKESKDAESREKGLKS